MLKPSDSIVFPAQVHISLKAFKAVFTLNFRLLDVDQLDALRERCQPKADGSFAMTDREFVGELVAGFGDDVLDEADQPLPFTPQNLTKVLNKPGALRAAIDAFYSGYAEEEEKNSELLPAG